MLDFNVVKQTGLKQKGELEHLFGVSRLMVVNYMNGKSLPRGENRVRIARTIRVLNGLLEKGKLPLSDTYDKESRLKAVQKIRDFVVSTI